MKITKIIQQVKNRRRYSIYIDEKYSFSLGESQLADSGLHAGQELSEQELSTYKQKSDLGKLYERTLKWLAIRPRSEWETGAYLTRICKDEGVQMELKNKLTNLGLINDSEFAASWIASRRTLRATSKRKLWVELKQKHVPGDIIEQALIEDDTDEREVLRALIERKKDKSQYRDKQKLIAYLARQGFRYDDIKEVIDELTNEN